MIIADILALLALCITVPLPALFSHSEAKIVIFQNSSICIFDIFWWFLDIMKISESYFCTFDIFILESVLFYANV